MCSFSHSRKRASGSAPVVAAATAGTARAATVAAEPMKARRVDGVRRGPGRPTDGRSRVRLTIGLRSALEYHSGPACRNALPAVLGQGRPAVLVVDPNKSDCAHG